MRDITRFCDILQVSDDDLRYADGDNVSDDAEPKMETRCSFGSVLENFTKNAFVIMGKGSMMSETYKEFPSDNPGAVMAQALEMGEDFGTIVRVGLDYQSP